MTRQAQINDIVAQNDYLHQVVHQDPGTLALDSRIVQEQVNHILDQGFVALVPAGPCTLAEARESLRAFRGAARNG